MLPTQHNRFQRIRPSPGDHRETQFRPSARFLASKIARPLVIAGQQSLEIFCLGILLNLASRSLPERLVMTPLVTALAVTSFLVARG